VSEGFQNLPHPRALAFLGDAVFEILLREMAVGQGLSHSKDLHAFTTQRARAEAQVALLHQIKPHLTEAELEIIRQGRNITVSTGRRAGQAAHRQATGFEALMGALYLTDRERLYALWHRMEPLLATVPEMEAAENLSPDNLLE
jgi:ribonuclease-3 family protein